MKDIGHTRGACPSTLGRGRGRAFGLAALLAGLAVWGCGDANTGAPAGSGGSSSTGGQITASGGARTGGTSVTGGATVTGGAGAAGTGGGSGGSAVPPTGGSVGTGGGSVGGATGGSVSLDGSAGGQAATGGTAGRDAGGMGGMAGSDGSVTADGAGSDGRLTGGVLGSGGQVGSGGSPSTGGIPSQGGSIAATGGSTTGPDGGTTTFDPCPATGACKIMPLGDSITEGTGYAGGYRGFLFSKAVADGKNITFVGSLTTNPPTGITNFPKSHEGHFGWTIQQIDDIVPTPTLNPSPHIILLHLGTNDVNQGLSGAPARLKSLINQIVTTLPSTLVVVAKIIPEPSKASGITAYNSEVPGIVQEFASSGKHVQLIDQNTGFPSTELGDGVHPNQAGYTRMANTWYEAIKAFLH